MCTFYNMGMKVGGQPGVGGGQFSFQHVNPGESNSGYTWQQARFLAKLVARILFSLDGPRSVCMALLARVLCMGYQCQCEISDLEGNAEVFLIILVLWNQEANWLMRLVMRTITRKPCCLDPRLLQRPAQPSPLPSEHDAFRIILDSRKCSPGEDIYSKPLAHWACACLGYSAAHSVLVGNKLFPDNLVAKGIPA